MAAANQTFDFSSNVQGSNLLLNNTISAQNVNIGHDDAHDATKARKALYDDLAFEGAHARRAQLSLPSISPTSLSWIWETEFKKWVQQPKQPFFWISGKPGSGKSTLIRYVSQSQQTRTLLETGGDKFIILDFFFDFRAGSSTANDISGLVKSFLTQLCSAVPELEKKLAEKNVLEPLQRIEVAGLLDWLADAIKTLPSRVCAFVDGLDEYTGDHADLAATLISIQDRTGMKIILASRQEAAFDSRFTTFPVLRMQDHNAHSIRAHVKDIIDKSEVMLIDSDANLAKYVESEICERAQGVILWAHLALDAILVETSNAVETRLTKTKVDDILKQLPQELEQLYDRILQNMPQRHSVEAATMLCLLSGLDGSADIFALQGFMDVVATKLLPKVGHKAALNLNVFRRRIHLLLGTLVEFSGLEVRLIHETLQHHLSRSSMLRQMLPESFSPWPPEAFQLNLYAETITLATQSSCIEAEAILSIRRRRLWLPYRLKDLDYLRNCVEGLVEKMEDFAWDVRVYALSQSIRDLPHSISMLSTKVMVYEKVVKSALSSSFMLLMVQRFQDLCKILKSPDGIKADVFDLVMGISLNLPDYSLATIQDGRPLTFAQEQLLLWLAREHVWTKPPGMFNVVQFLIQRRAILDPHLFRTITYYIQYRYEYFTDDKDPAVAKRRVDFLRTILSLKPSANLGSTDLLFNWLQSTLHFYDELCFIPIAQTLMNFLLQSGLDVNSTDSRGRNGLHVIVEVSYGNVSRHQGQMRLYQLVLLARLGIKPCKDRDGRTPLDILLRNIPLKARQWGRINKFDRAVRLQLLTWIVDIGRDDYSKLKRIQQGILTEILRYWQKHKEWPDFTNYEFLTSPELEEFTKIDSSGLIVVSEAKV